MKARIVSLALLFSLTGCASYVTPGRGVAMTSLTNVNSEIAEKMTREPRAEFPAHIAVVRVQAPGYRSNSCESYGSGRYSVVTTREIENDDDWNRFEKLPKVAGVGLVNRMLIPSQLQSDRELREAAASLKADMLMAYTVDTVFRIDEHDFGPLRLISLGMLPTKEARVTATCSAAIFDVRTGYVYGLAESTAVEKQIASSWTSEDAVDQSRHKAERKAFAQMLRELEKTWGKVVTEYDHPAAQAQR